MTSWIQQRLAAIAWTSDRTFTLDGVEFGLEDFGWPYEGDGYAMMKPRHYLEAYARGLDGLEGPDVRNVLELGIRRGGSTVFLALLLQPDKLVAIDISKRVKRLEAFRTGDARGARIAAAYHTSQDDAQALTELLERETEGPLDLVIDDASHAYAQTRSSFEILFPRLRPGGVYVIEDWQWAHVRHFYDWRDQPALSNLVFQLLMICAGRASLVASVEVHPGVVFVRRGRAEPSTERLDLESLYWTQNRPFTLL